MQQRVWQRQKSAGHGKVLRSESGLTFGTLTSGPVVFLKSRMILAMMPSYGSFVTGWTKP